MFILWNDGDGDDDDDGGDNQAENASHESVDAAGKHRSWGGGLANGYNSDVTQLQLWWWS